MSNHKIIYSKSKLISGLDNSLNKQPSQVSLEYNSLIHNIPE